MCLRNSCFFILVIIKFDLYKKFFDFKCYDFILVVRKKILGKYLLLEI